MNYLVEVIKIMSDFNKINYIFIIIICNFIKKAMIHSL